MRAMTSGSMVVVYTPFVTVPALPEMFPVMSPEKFDVPVTTSVPPTVALFETLRAEVEAFPVTARFVVEAFVNKELIAVRRPV